MGDNGVLFQTYLADNIERIDGYVLGHMPSPLPKGGQVQDLRTYLYSPLTRFVEAGGKRIRPALCLLGAEAVGANPQVASSLAAAVELFQAAALIHDDIADDGTMRRGEPCVHLTEGVGLAINAGDAALVAVTSSILGTASLSPQVRMDLLMEVVAMERHTLEGQALDLGWARDNRWDISVSDYLEMARSKTAYYSAAVPLAMGAISGGGSLIQIEGLRRFGMRTGLAFQIQDDLLNLVGDAQAQGKDYRTDITEGKRTLVMVWALEHLEQTEREELVDILQSKTSDAARIDRAVELARESGALDHARSYARDLTRRAKDELLQLDIAEHARAVLLSMSDFFIERAN